MTDKNFDDNSAEVPGEGSDAQASGPASQNHDVPQNSDAPQNPDSAEAAAAEVVDDEDEKK
jgi:molecular chaperone GrpE